MTCTPLHDQPSATDVGLQYAMSAVLDGLGRYRDAALSSLYGWVSPDGATPGQEYLDMSWDSTSPVSGLRTMAGTFGDLAATVLRASAWLDGEWAPLISVSTGNESFILDNRVCNATSSTFLNPVNTTKLRIWVDAWPQPTIPIDSFALRVEPEFCSV